VLGVSSTHEETKMLDLALGGRGGTGLRQTSYAIMLRAGGRRR
jgi:hypothetical protein